MLERALNQNKSVDISKIGTNTRDLITLLKSIKRFDINPIDNGEFIELEEVEEEDGQFVRWEDIEKILKNK